MDARTTHEVLESHLQFRQQGNLDADLEQNYAEDAMLLTTYGIFHGREGVRTSANILFQQLHNAHYMYRTRLVHGPIAYLEWTGENDTMCAKDGADTYFIEDGRIKVQTIHYTLISL